MKKIAIFCDGTWNSPTIAEPTSVRKLSQALINDPARHQQVFYFQGIGSSDRFDRGIRKWLKKYGGGAFGWGLDGKVKEAYQAIALFYRPGDEIYLFGFSRGAYTARSVAGMIRKCGIVRDTSEDGINAAFQLYRKRGPENAPDEPHIWAERRAVSPDFATSDDDLKLRQDQSHLVRINYVGVLDTVGARGIPPSVFGPAATLWNRQYTFHDMALSSLVKSARQALALDERRPLFKPATWDNLDDRPQKPGLNGGRTDPLRPYQQKWFAGNHRIIGGSSQAAQALCAFPLEWVLQGAGGLALDPEVPFPPTAADALIDADEIDHSWGAMKRWRSGPVQPWDVHASALARARGRTDYQPASLRRFL